jgi:molecular chaperone GrpE
MFQNEKKKKIKKEAEKPEAEKPEIKEEKSKEQEYLDGWKRCQADFENYKKAQAEAQKEFVKYAGQNIVMQIIPVLDNFHMSTDHVPEDQKDNAWVVGIMHIQKQLENVLAENGATEIETKEGDKFDPAIHEAVENSSQSTVHSSEKEKNDQEQRTNNQELIKKVLLKGYKLNGKVLRPVKVIVE